MLPECSGFFGFVPVAVVISVHSDVDWLCRMVTSWQPQTATGASLGGNSHGGVPEAGQPSGLRWTPARCRNSGVRCSESEPDYVLGRGHGIGRYSGPSRSRSISVTSSGESWFGDALDGTVRQPSGTFCRRRQRGSAGAQYAGSSGLINIKRDDALLHYLTGHYLCLRQCVYGATCRRPVATGWTALRQRGYGCHSRQGQLEARSDCRVSGGISTADMRYWDCQ